MEICDRNVDIDSFVRRHIGPNDDEVRGMLREVGFENLDALIDAAVPKNIRLDRELNLPEAKSETEALAELRAISKKNKVARSFIGTGYSGKGENVEFANDSQSGQLSFFPAFSLF